MGLGAKMKSTNIMQGKLFRLWAMLCLGFLGFASANANAAPSLTLGIVSGQPGNIVNVPVSFDNDGSVVGLQFDVQYDSTQLGAGTAVADSSLSVTGHGISSSVIAPGTLRVVITPPLDNAVISTGVIASLPFTLNTLISGTQVPAFANVTMSESTSLSVVVDQLNNGLIAVVGDNNSDSDLDGLPDAWEISYGLDPLNTFDAVLDTDSDGISALDEYAYGTNPTSADSDSDGMDDGWEVQYGLDPTNPADALLDMDGDGVSNLDEYLAGTDPTVSSISADVCPSGCAYSSIQAAINAASSGGTVIVGPGTYNESITINKYLTLQSATGASNTIIDATGLGQSVIFINTKNSYQMVNIVGFTIKGGQATIGGGIHIYGGATIKNNIIRENSASYGGGIRVRDYQYVNIEDNLFESNSAAWYGGAIWLGSYATQIVNRNTFVGNTASTGGAVATPAYGSDTVKNNLFINNYKTIYTASYANTKLINNTIIDGTGYAVGKGPYGGMSIINSILWNNASNPGGYGWTIDHSLVDIDPMFVDAANGDYQLQSGSPAIDTGMDASVYGVTVDRDGNTRPQDGDGLGAGTTGDGSDFDIGAIEYVPVP
jgi:hypothetical protein